MEPALSAKNLAIGYEKGNLLFESVNLSLYKGQLVCFMGPNGIGKSTLIRTLAGLQKPVAGMVSGTGSKKIAVVLTDQVAKGMMTVRDLVSYGRYPYLNWSVKMEAADQAIINEVIDKVHLGRLIERPLIELSDGQLQMALIARALAQDTPVLLLDEPTAHLDLNNRVEIMGILRTLARKNNKAVLIATHELDLALQTADLIWLATHHKSIHCGIPEDLVLDGSFDEVFRLKGFDLKTGKILQQPFRKVTIQLQGDGPVYLWTKNALERNGYRVGENPDITVAISSTDPPGWKLIQKEITCSAGSIGQLLMELNKGRLFHITDP